MIPRPPHPLVTLCLLSLIQPVLLTAAIPPETRGEVLLSTFHCTACHPTQGIAPVRIPSHTAPSLTNAGDRIAPAYLRRLLTNPGQTHPGIVMPDVLSQVPASERAGAVDDLVAFLSSRHTGPNLLEAPVEPNSMSIELGRQLFHSVGCVACHRPIETPGSLSKPADPAGIQPTSEPDASDRPLPDLSSKTSVPALAAFLKDPFNTRPSGRMPSLSLTDREADAIARYLLRDQARTAATTAPVESPGLHFAYYEHAFDTDKPDFDALIPVGTGTTRGFSLDARRRNENFGFRFEGLLNITNAATYTLATVSDDGSRLWIDDRLVVQNDGAHAMTEKKGLIDLQPGKHRIRVDYFNQAAEFGLRVFIESPSLKRQPLRDSWLSHAAKPQTLTETPFNPDPARADAGRQRFLTLGCARCHEPNTPLPASNATPLIGMAKRTDQGCLSGSPEQTPHHPVFKLSPADRAALSLALKNPTRLATPPPAGERVELTLSSLQCRACHRRDATGGPSATRAEYFTTLGTADLGDEGRIPPHLENVGAKLNPAWMTKVLDGKGAVRPYMATRMPRFAPVTVQNLPRDFAQADDPGAPATAAPQAPDLDAKYGRILVGTTGVSCIACHVFNGRKSLGIPALDLATAPERLKPTWFSAYLRDPQSLRPGTRMPSFWPDNRSSRADLLAGDATRQIQAIWSYLQNHSTLGPPPGLVQGRQELVADTEAVLYRNFIAGAGPRAIGVGYPEKANLAFDAEDVRLALIWQGPFIDAARHRTGRGEGFEPPLGHNIVPFPEGPAFAHLDTPAQPWTRARGKAAGLRMQGYRLDPKQRPTFLYQLESVQIEDTPEAIPGDPDPILRRTLQLKAPGNAPETLWFQACAAGKITLQAGPQPTAIADNRVTFSFEGIQPDDLLIRDGEGGRSELLLHVRFTNGQARFVEIFKW